MALLRMAPSAAVAEMSDQRTRAAALTFGLAGTSAQAASATISAVRYFAAP